MSYPQLILKKKMIGIGSNLSNGCEKLQKENLMQNSHDHTDLAECLLLSSSSLSDSLPLFPDSLLLGTISWTAYTGNQKQETRCNRHHASSVVD